MAGVDPALVLATLSPAEREVVERWLVLLGLEVDELDACPPLRQLVEMVAVLTLAADVPLCRAEAFDEAAGALGLNGPTLLRRWYRVQARAVRQFVIEDDGVA